MPLWHLSHNLQSLKYNTNFSIFGYRSTHCEPTCNTTPSYQVFIYTEHPHLLASQTLISHTTDPPQSLMHQILHWFPKHFGTTLSCHVLPPPLTCPIFNSPGTNNIYTGHRCNSRRTKHEGRCIHMVHQRDTRLDKLWGNGLTNDTGC